MAYSFEHSVSAAEDPRSKLSMPEYKSGVSISDGVARKAHVVNLFGAAGSGKSTLASGLHYELKKMWIQAEIAREYAKDVIHQNTPHWFEQAVLVLAEQSSRIEFIADKYDYVITDGPIMLASWYAPKTYSPAFHHLCRELFDGFQNINFFLHRTHPYDSNGRMETERQARQNEVYMRQWLDSIGIVCYDLYSSHDNATMVTDFLVDGIPLPPLEERPPLKLRKSIQR